MIIETGKTYIRKLRAISVEVPARVVRRDPLALQLRLNSVLSAVDLQPYGVPALAIVCIRSLHAPHLPAQYTRYGGGRPPLWWEECVRALIKQAIQQAAHPLEGNVPVNTEAVIFADRAELLACLASDWCAGNGSDRWWWQSLFRNGEIGQLLLPAWLETSEYIPVALHYLAIQHKIVPFVRRLPSYDACALLQSITRSFALHKLQPILATAFQSERTGGPSWQVSTVQPLNVASSMQESAQHTDSHIFPLAEEVLPLPGNAATPLEESRRTLTASQLNYGTTQENLPHHKPFILPPEIPWRPWVPESMEQGLSLEQQALLGIGLMLVRVPSIVRTTSFARAVYRWHSKTDVEPDEFYPAQLETMQNGHPRPVETWEGYGADAGALCFSSSDGDSVGVHAPSVEMSPDGPQETPEASLSGEDKHSTSTQPHSLPLQNVRHASNQLPLFTPKDDVLQTERRQPQEALLVNEGERGKPSAYSQASNYDGDSVHEYSGGGDGNGDDGSGTNMLQSSQSSTSDDHGDRSHDQSAQTGNVSQRERGRPQGPPPPSTQTTPAPTDMGIETGKHSPSARIETAFGGIFYLINLGLFLDLYGDFTTPLQPGLALSMWDFMALLGQQMMGGSLQTDPLWSLLASLSGRHVEESPDYYFEPPEQWRVPVTWLRAFPMQDNKESWCWSVEEDGRLRVLHPAHFLLLDIPLDTFDPLEQLRREMQSYSELWGQVTPQLSEGQAPLFPNEKLLPCGRLAVNTFADNVPQSLLRWLHWLMPYIYARLQCALGLTQTDDPCHVLCLHSASISVTATHVDIFLALKDLPIEIRIAGLDRDPGWVPAAGRFIAFHFQ